MQHEYGEVLAIHMLLYLKSYFISLCIRLQEKHLDLLNVAWLHVHVHANLP